MVNKINSWDFKHYGFCVGPNKQTAGTPWAGSSFLYPETDITEEKKAKC